MRFFPCTRWPGRWIASFFGAFFWVFASSAQDAAKVRTKLEVKGVVWVGQAVTLVLDLLSPGFFAGSPTFYLPRVPEVLILQPEERPVLGSETIDGARYAVQRHEFSIFAQRAGIVTIPSFQVRFSTRQGAAAPIEQSLRTDVATFEVKLPPGADGLATLISTRELKAGEIWQPDSGTAKVGDAFTRSVTFSASDIPAMMFPPFATPDIAGLGVYPNAPRLLDQRERGAMRGQRQDTITYVCQRPGRFVVPAVRFIWWDLDHRQLRRVDFPARTFKVAANAALSDSSAASIPKEVRISRVETIGLGVVAVFIAVLVGVGRWISRRRPDLWRSISFWRPVRLAPLNPSTPTEISKRAK